MAGFWGAVDHEFQADSIFRLLASLPALALFITGAPATLQAYQYLGHTDSDAARANQVVAVIDDRSIQMREVDDRIRSQLTDYNQRLYAARLSSLNSLIDELLFEREAALHGFTARDYLTSLIDQRPVTTSEVGEVYANIQLRLPDLAPAEVKRQITEELKETRRREIYEDIIRTLRAHAEIAILLPIPSQQVKPSPLSGLEPILGRLDAPITIIEFLDFECPFCKQLQNSLTALLERRPGIAKLVFRSLPLPSHKFAFFAAEAAYCAQKQGAFWDYQARVFSLAKLDRAALLNAGRAVSADPGAFDACIDKGASRSQVNADIAEAERLGITGTPTLLVNGKAFPGVLPVNALEQLLLEELARVSVNSAPIR